MSEVKKRTLTQQANALNKIQSEYTSILHTMQEGTQCYNVLKYLLARGSITNKEAADNFGIYRLGARIADLRRKGISIATDMIPTKGGKSTSAYARYRIESKEN